LTTEGDNSTPGPDGTGPDDSQTTVTESVSLVTMQFALTQDPDPAPPKPLPVKPVSDEEELTQAAQDDLKLLAEAARFASAERVGQVIEALLFAAEKPLDLPGLMEATQFSQEQVTTGLTTLSESYKARNGGIALANLGGRWQLRTEPAVGAYVRRMLQVKPLRLTRAAMETLAIIAYRQPLTRPEMEDIRGVDCGAVTKALLDRKLVRILGKKDEPGRPLIYGTSKEFLELFNLRDLTQLPTLREFQELSEESRKIVEEELPGEVVPPVAGLVAMAHDPALAEKMKEAAVESDAALEQLEKAMEIADEQAKSTAAVLNPNPPPGPAGANNVAASSTAEGAHSPPPNSNPKKE
jgi:segregation and condensation protein B